MILDCLARVIRTGGIKTAAAAEQRADGNLVQTQQRDQDRLHGIRNAQLLPSGEAREPWLDSARAPHAPKTAQTCGPGGDSGCGSGAPRLAISRATLPSKYSISVRNNAFSGGEAALGNAALSIRVDRRNSTSQPSNSVRRRRKLSRAVRFTRLRVAARGANFLPTTSPRRAA